MEEQIVLPLYTCHKEVRAAKIARVDYLSATFVRIYFENGDLGYLDRSVEDRPKPQPGWYYVDYGTYYSFSPAETFEDGYSLKGE